MRNPHALSLCHDLEDQPAFAVCQSIELTAEGELPEWIPLVPAGKHVDALDGRKFSNANPQAVVDAFNADPRDIPLDWNHSTEIKAPNGDPSPAAAWIDKLEIRNGGEIWGHIKEWTPDGATSVQTKSHRYISPAFVFHKASKLIAKIVSAALVNRPALNMPSIAHSRYSATEERTMDREKLIAELGLASDATDEQIFAALGKLKFATEAAKKVQGELATAKAELDSTKTELANARNASPSLSEYVPRSQHDATVAKFNELRAEVESSKAEKRKADIDSTIETALSEGKIVPASVEQYTAICSTDEGLAQVRALFATLPAKFEPSTLDKREPPKPALGGTSMTAEEKTIAKDFGMSEAEYLEQRAAAIAEATGAN